MLTSGVITFSFWRFGCVKSKASFFSLDTISKGALPLK
jgi:hypothetical protein